MPRAVAILLASRHRPFGPLHGDGQNGPVEAVFRLVGLIPPMQDKTRHGRGIIAGRGHAPQAHLPEQGIGSSGPSAVFELVHRSIS